MVWVVLSQVYKFVFFLFTRFSYHYLWSRSNHSLLSKTASICAEGIEFSNFFIFSLFLIDFSHSNFNFNV
jgi:hypothetical protein